MNLSYRTDKKKETKTIEATFEPHSDREERERGRETHTGREREREREEEEERGER